MPENIAEIGFGFKSRLVFSAPHLKISAETGWRFFGWALNLTISVEDMQQG